MSETLKNEKMVLVEGGTFQMGSASDSSGSADTTGRTVEVKSFYMGEHLVTQKKWLEVMETDITHQWEEAIKSGFRPMCDKGDDYPMCYVNWCEAVEYCNKRSKKEGLSLAYKKEERIITRDLNANGYRLPTEAEWEYAAKGKNKNPVPYEIPSGTPDLVALGLVPYPVETAQPNSLGLYDMSGRIGEWCDDGIGEHLEPEDLNINRIIRRGKCTTSLNDACLTFRGKLEPWMRSYALGFRVVLPLK
jgi:formylglycine-generating enzyme required for sulfatase activity